MKTHDLEPIKPQDAVDLYLTHRKREVTQATLNSHRSRLQFFTRWCAHNNITNLNTLTGRKLHQYRLWRRTDGDLAPTSEKTQMDTIRVFIRFLETIDAVHPDLHTKVLSPDLDNNENIRTDILTNQTAHTILKHLEKYHYASRPHITLLLMWHTMMRRGAIRALDTTDFHPSQQYLQIRHRPETDTPLKNKTNGERTVALSEKTTNTLTDWIETNRPNTTDQHGREPLLTSKHGRIHRTTPTKITYNWTRPCRIGHDCPIDRNPDTCEAATYNTASLCPESVSSHAIRRGAITHHLKSDVPSDVVSERANVGYEVLEAHYDQRSEVTKMEQRRKYLSNI